MRDRLAALALALLGHLPLGFAQALGRGIGRVAWNFAGREQRNARINLRLCFPEQTLAWHTRVAKASLRELVAASLEMPCFWRYTQRELEACLVNREVLHEILDVYRAGHGLVIAAPHLGSWEFVGSLIAARTRMTTLFRPSRTPALDPIIKAGRERQGARLVPTDSSGVRALARALGQGECIGILPDQQPTTGNGMYADFFGHPAYTMVLLPRLVARHRVPVVTLFAQRLSGGRFQLHHRWMGEDLYDPDLGKACAEMNRSIEALVRQCPEQYNWIYKRFRKQPDDANPYSAPQRDATSPS
ncbi:MAG: lysophospholipid acyltransferase family protein [Thiotrichales bacterium]